MNIRSRTIASPRPAAYLRRVSFAPIIRFLTILALALSPLAAGAPASAMTHQAAMAAGASAMAGHQTTGHKMAAASMTAMPGCEDMDGRPKDRPCGSSDCMVACAAVPALPAAGGQLEPQAPLHGPEMVPTLVPVPNGLVPEAATPPPRGFLTI